MKLDKAVYRRDPDVIEALAEVEASTAVWVARCALEKEEKAREKKRRGRYAKAEAMGFICE